MFDRRYPNLCRVMEASGDGVWYFDRSHWARTSTEVCKRCPGLSCAYDRASRTLFFYLGHDPSRGVHRVRTYNPSGSAHTFASHEVDEIVRLIQSAKMPRVKKEAIAAQHERELQAEGLKQRRHMQDCKRSDRLAVVKRTCERKGMHSGYRSHFLIDKKPSKKVSAA